jgi:hypothetical protein
MQASQSAAPGGAQRGLRNDQLSGLLLVLFALFVAWQNRAFPLGSLHDPGPGYMPLLLAIFLGAMGLLIVAFGGRSAPVKSIVWPEAGRAALIIIVCAFGAFALERIGYRLTMMALLIFFLGVIERKRPLAVAAVAIGFSLLSYFLFSTLLKVQLPRSPWGF